LPSLNALTPPCGTPTRGLDNDLRIGGSNEFQAALVNTLGLTLASFLLEAALGLAVALALHRALRGSRVFRAVVALPLMVAPVVGALAWRFIFVDGYGLIDSLASHFRRRRAVWFADVWLARATIVIAQPVDGAALRHPGAAGGLPPARPPTRSRRRRSTARRRRRSCWRSCCRS
jgi:ABC-type sugar transport system permease subunit